MMNQSLLKPASYAAMERETVLKNGLGTRYGLGVSVRSELGERAIEHGGEVSGFVSDNLIFPDDRAAVAVLTNEDASAAASMIAHAVGPLLISGEDASAARDQEQALAIFKGLQHGKITACSLPTMPTAISLRRLSVILRPAWGRWASRGSSLSPAATIAAE